MQAEIQEQPSVQTFYDFLEEQEKKYFTQLLVAFNWQKVKAAKAAGITRKTLWQKAKKYGIKQPN